MTANKIVKAATKDITAAFKVGGVTAAAVAFNGSDYTAFGALILANLKAEKAIPLFLLERVVPRDLRGLVFKDE